MPAGNNQGVNGRLGGNILKGENLVILKNNPGGQAPRGDSAKNAGVHRALHGF
jgi:hypothetical protein